MGFVKIFWKNNFPDAYLQKTGISIQIVSEIQILLNLTWVWTFIPSQIEKDLYWVIRA